MAAILLLKDHLNVTLNDFGSGVIFLMMFGLPFGILIDYIWNRLVLSLTLRHIIKITPDSNRAPTLKRIDYYTFFITVLGLIIDLGYYVLIWSTVKNAQITIIWIPNFSMPVQLAFILIPMALLLAANYLLSNKYLKLERKSALITGPTMAFFTAPWLVPVFPYIANWTG